MSSQRVRHARVGPHRPHLSRPLDDQGENRIERGALHQILSCIGRGPWHRAARTGDDGCPVGDLFTTVWLTVKRRAERLRSRARHAEARSPVSRSRSIFATSRRRSARWRCNHLISTNLRPRGMFSACRATPQVVQFLTRVCTRLQRLSARACASSSKQVAAH
jgi:hypothetical protein